MIYKVTWCYTDGRETVKLNLSAQGVRDLCGGTIATLCKRPDFERLTYVQGPCETRIAPSAEEAA